MLEVAKQVETAANRIRERVMQEPRVGLILGTGLGKLADTIESPAVIPFSDVPHFPVSTAIGHKGQLVCGQLYGVDVVAMQGRFHLYEGYSAQAVALPVRVMKSLGIEALVVSNASGGLNPAYESGDVMVIDDHINLMWQNPLIGVNDDALGPRFPDMCTPYDPTLIELAMQAARESDFNCHRGVYAALSGPTYETRAEYRMLRHLGADVVGMSTIPEVIVATHAGLKCLGLSVVTNVCRPDTLETTDGHQVQAAAELAESKMQYIVEAVVRNI